VAARVGRIDVAIGMTMLAAGATGFLALNWPPARIFMGDVGSTFLGFSFGAWALVTVTGASGGLTPLVWIVALFPFLFDGTYTLLRRVLRGEPVYRAHRSHLYQRLVQTGWTHRGTTLLYAVLAVWSSMWMVLHYGYGIGSPLLTFAVAVAPVILLPMLVRMSSEVSA
jgi:UDP-N-acetylmuramyl pentapeptide phosphotransferase/UDP-N-acetylglucosamine-1-phosphate transferase